MGAVHGAVDIAGIKPEFRNSYNGSQGIQVSVKGFTGCPDQAPVK